MLIFVFTKLTLLKTTADLVPPFETTENGGIGLWEFTGSAGLVDDVILLVPPVQYSAGSAWTNSQIPTGEWSVTYKIKIYEGSGGGGFGIWFVDKYGAYGQLHGGPEVFKGFGLTGTIITNDNRSHSLKLSFLENDGTTSYDYSTLPDPIFYKFHRADDLSFEFRFNYKNLVITLTEANKHTKLFQKDITVPYQNNYMGISANSDQFTTRIDLLSIKFKLNLSDKRKSSDNEDEKMNTRDATLSNKDKTGKYQPKETILLRNPVFSATTEALQSLSQQGEQFSNDMIDVTVQKVLNIISEMTFASTDVASFTELNDFITRTLSPHAQKWQKRTIRMVDQVKQSRDIFETAFDSTKDILENWNATIISNTEKATKHVYGLDDLLKREAEMEIEETEEGLKAAVEGSGLVKALIGIACAEIVMMALLFVALRSGKVHLF
ncbi:Legume-like lectin family protein [Histomonas meleagridis]|uniref:Legume-like lectin family protein n=1 Tax=Histomonas meleagridis TaxID=135588 RepID=UPI00355A6D20|nr:Legume-like lectin family protein [Histomonas meleagridis]KAH0803864.1 Legume-like lectin family protein [Histomonas meleagridis]